MIYFFKPLRKKSNGRMLGDREPLKVGMRHGRDGEWTFEGERKVGNSDQYVRPSRHSVNKVGI